MIITDKKKAVGILMSRLDEKGRLKTQATVKSEYNPDPKSQALNAICEDVIGAVQSGSANDLASALKAFFESVTLED